jgi:putative flippase GtrA
VGSSLVPPRLRRWGLFNLVGLAGFILQLTAIALLTRVWGLHYLAATVIGMQAAIVHNYFAHSRWTWADRPALTEGERRMRPLRYGGVKTVSLGVNVILTAGFVSQASLPPEVANVLAVAFCALLNYAAADRLVFRSGAGA